MAGSHIPGVETFHPRSSWVPQTGSWHGNLMPEIFHPAVPAYKPVYHIDRSAVHYTSAIDIPDGDPDEILNGEDGIRALLRNALSDYLINRTSSTGYTRPPGAVGIGLTQQHFPGYWLGYNWAYDWLGGIWEIRGTDYGAAATNQHNNHTVAHLMLTDRHDHGTPEMWAALRAHRRYLEQNHYPNLADRPWGHREFFENTGTGTQTGCPGDANIADLHAGLGDLTYQPPAPPSEDPMVTVPRVEPYLMRMYGYQEVVYVDGTSAIPVTADTAALHGWDEGTLFAAQVNPMEYHPPTYLWLCGQLNVSDLTPHAPES